MSVTDDDILSEEEIIDIEENLHIDHNGSDDDTEDYEAEMIELSPLLSAMGITDPVDREIWMEHYRRQFEKE